MTESDIHIRTHGSQILTLVDLPKRMVDETRAFLTPDGLNVRAVDPVNVAIVNYDVGRSGFETYEYNTDDDKVTFGVNLTRLSKVLSSVTKGRGLEGGDPVDLRLTVNDYSEVSKVEVTTETKGVELSDVFFALDPDSIHTEPNIPDVSDNQPVKQELPTHGFKKAVNHIRQFFTHLRFEATPDGDDDAKVNVVGRPSPNSNGGKNEERSSTVSFPERKTDADIEGMRTVGDAKGYVETMLSMDYVKPIAEAIHAGGRMDDLRVRFGNDYLVTFKYRQPDWELTGRYMVAPRIEH